MASIVGSLDCSNNETSCVCWFPKPNEFNWVFAKPVNQIPEYQVKLEVIKRIISQRQNQLCFLRVPWVVCLKILSIAPFSQTNGYEKYATLANDSKIFSRSWVPTSTCPWKINALFPAGGRQGKVTRISLHPAPFAVITVNRSQREVPRACPSVASRKASTRAANAHFPATSLIARFWYLLPTARRPAYHNFGGM